MAILCQRCQCLGCPGDLDQFLAAHGTRGWLCQPDFAIFYARRSHFAPLDSIQSKPTIELANIRAERPGAGAFRRLVTHLCNHYPDHYLFVESVGTERFRQGLIRLGFLPAAYQWNFYRPTDHLT